MLRVLPKYIFFGIYNKSGATLDGNADLDFKIVPWKYDSNGAVVYGTEVTFTVDQNISNGLFSILTGADEDIDNTTDKNLGLFIFVNAKPGTSSGTVEVWVHGSNDASIYASNEQGWHIGTVVITTDKGDNKGYFAI